MCRGEWIPAVCFPVLGGGAGWERTAGASPAGPPRPRGGAGGVASRVALQAGRALVHEVSRVADHPRDSQGTAAVQLTDQGPQAALTQTCVRGREVDQVAVVRHDGLDARRRDGGAERVDVRRRDRGLAPLAWRLGEDLDGGCPDRRAARRRVRHAALGRDVCAQQVVRPRIPPPPPPPPGSPEKASRQIRGTNRTPPPRPPSPPPAALRRRTSSWAAGSPIGTTRPPPRGRSPGGGPGTRG